MSEAAAKIPDRKHHEAPVPKQVRDAVVAADAIRAEMDKPTAPPTPGADAPPAVLPTPPAAGAQPPPVVPLVPPAEGETLEQRHKSLQGRFEQVNRNNAELGTRLNQLEQTIATLQARGAEPPAPPAVPAPRPKLVTEAEATEYGEDFLGVVGRRAREEYSPEFEQLAARLNRIENQVQGVGTVIARTQTANIYTTLGEKVPDWRTINRSEEFKTWLQEPEGYSGRMRQDLLQEAFTRQETDRVVRFFQGFLTEATGLPPDPQARTPSAPPLAPPGNGSGKPSLEDFAAPGRARSGPQDLPPDKPIYSSAWIAKFMADKRTGKYKGREADADAIERDIYQAQHEGRIQ